jgi:hypothetical protein
MKTSVICLLLFFGTFSINCYGREATKYPYEARQTDAFVGLFGGTGCSRHWDFLDAHDSTLSQPFDRCGAYLMVSALHHKWVDSRIYNANMNWWEIVPIRGDGVLTQATCTESPGKAVYVLKEYADCGGPSIAIAVCDEQGRALPVSLLGKCHSPQ